MKVDIGVCTFRRESLFFTLDSLAAQHLPPAVRIRVIVADNDDDAQLRGAVDSYAKRMALDITYVHAPARNISIARNACLEHSDADVLLFIDDDELASVNWVAALLDAAHGSGAGIVFGPAHAVYPPEAPEWMRSNRFHSNLPTANKQIVETGFSCNTLLDLRNPHVRVARFDPAFGRTGGEDVDFFFRLHRKGVLMAICETAIVYEPVAPNRMSFSWILDKSQATGMIYGFCAIDGKRRKVPGFLARSGLKALYCGLRAAAAVNNKTGCAFWIIRGSFHFGVVKSCFMRPCHEFYGEE